MKINDIKWPPTPGELAWLLLHYTYRRIAEHFGIRHNKVQRLRDKYGILRLSRKVRSKLLTRQDFSLWKFEGPHDNPPTFLKGSERNKTAVYFDNKLIPMSLDRALFHIRLGRVIPTFIDVHHVCHDKGCNNPDHHILVSEQAHHAYHNGKVKKIPYELTFDLSHYCSDSYGPDFIVGSYPDVNPIGTIPDEDWEEFLINCMLAKMIMKKAIEQEQRDGEHEAEETDDLKKEK